MVKDNATANKAICRAGGIFKYLDRLEYTLKLSICSGWIPRARGLVPPETDRPRLSVAHGAIRLRLAGASGRAFTHGMSASVLWADRSGSGGIIWCSLSVVRWNGSDFNFTGSFPGIRTSCLHVAQMAFRSDNEPVLRVHSRCKAA